MNMLLKLIGIIALIALIYFGVRIYGLSGMGKLHHPDERPFYMTTKPMTLKQLSLPAGTKIIYRKGAFWQKKEQDKPLDATNIMEIHFPEGTPLIWAGVPITSVIRFYNSSMTGFTVSANFEQLNSEAATPLSTLWQSCDEDLGVLVEDIEDWSFNPANIVDVASCGVNHQRYFKEDLPQQAFLDHLREALLNTRE